MKRSELKSKANITKQPKDISDYKKQRNLVVKLNKERKNEYFENLQTLKTLNHFGISLNLIFLTNIPMENLKLSCLKKKI